MDDLDWALLDELEQNGYQKADVLAASLDVSKRTVYRRIQILRRNRIIQVIAVPNPILLGYEAWAEIGIKVKPGSLKFVGQQLIEDPLTYSVITSVGEFDILTDVFFKTLDELASFVNLKLTAIKGVTKTETILLRNPIKYFRLFKSTNGNLDSSIVQELQPHTSQDRIEGIDHKIIQLLRKNGIIRLSEMKSSLGIGESTIRKHIKAMLERNLFSVEVITNPSVVKYEAWATIGLNVDHHFAYDSIDKLVNNQAVYFVGMTISRFNFVLGVRFRNMELLHQFVKMEIPSLGGVNSVEILPYTHLLKYHGITWYEEKVLDK